jgi:dTDP-4-amino-4,6-dideoxygalactose transaminase
MPDLAIRGGNPVRRSPYPRWPEVDARDEQAVLDVVRSGHWWMYSYGKDEFAGTVQGTSRVEAFEQAFAGFQHAPHAIATSSGSACLEIACRAIGLQPGDEVITTPYTFVATCTCILNAHAVPVFVDIEPNTYNIDPREVEKAVTDKTRAIIPVHFGGNLADMNSLLDIASRHNLRIIEDAAHAHGASLTGDRWAGTIGDIGIFSLQQSKLLTCGEGGVITTANEELADLSWSLRHYGRTQTGKWYEHFRLGWHYRMSELQGALALSQLDKAPAQNARRRPNARLLMDKLAGFPGMTICDQNPETDQDVYYVLCARYNPDLWDGISRDELIAAVADEGVPLFAGYSFPLYENPMFQSLESYHPASTIDFRSYRERCPATEKACRTESIWLTQDLLMGDEQDTLDIVRALEKVYEHRRELAR